MRFAEVIVDLSASAVDRGYTYIVPDGMELAAGDMVKAPFGNRTVEGFVISIKSETDVPENKLKPILQKRGGDSAILPELFDLAIWMRSRYNCYLVDALRLMIPAEMRGERVREKTIRVAQLIASYDEAAALCARAPKQLAVVECLKTGAKPVSFINTVVSGASAVVNALCKKGLIGITDTRSMRAPDIDEGGRSHTDPELTRAQRAAADELTEALSNGGGRYLLYGVTGSGKTEVYIRLIREALKLGRGAIVLVPEIALTPQMVGWFHARFGTDAAVIHSRLSAGERFDEWERIRAGKARVVIGARSAVFAPIQNLGCIIVDEEHESAYQSEKRPRYDAREVAWQRVEANGGVLLLGSATPSISSFMRAMPGVRPENKLKLLELSERALGRPMPECEVVDMRRELELGNKGIFSSALIKALRECVADGRQAMLFINRRGHSTFVSCRSCGHVEKCGFCDVAMTFHQSDMQMRCHYCGKSLPPPTVCPECGSKFIKYFGSGTQRVEQEVKEFLPNVSVARMDIDTTQGKNGHAKILDSFRKGDIRVLVGTQMIAKGLDFPNVTLVGVVAADTTLYLPDYRSAERTFQLITQVAGRAGRAEAPGRVVIQTYDPEHYALQCAVKQDYRAFYRMEATYRRRALYPPYTVIARLLVSAEDEQLPAKVALELEKKLTDALFSEKLNDDVLCLRASEAPIKRLRGETRWQVFVKMYTKGDVAAITSQMESLAREGAQGARIELEINPSSMI